MLAAAGTFVAVRATRPLARPVVRSSVAASVSVPGGAPAVPWPAAGQAAVSVPALGYAAQSAPETPVPIASLTKMTTALIVLRDHPLAPGAAGPLITITADDAAQFGLDTANDQSSVPVATGEQLSERQMLEALLLPSANNIAYALAEWDAGSQAAFVAKMNATAAGLGATSTHYVDASGFDAGSVSTAADCLRIAAAAMSIPAFAQIVAMPSAPFPMAGTIDNVIGGVGSAGIVGVKSGFTSVAGGCLVLAADRTVAGRPVLVLAAVLGQPVEPPPPPAKTAGQSRRRQHRRPAPTHHDHHHDDDAAPDDGPPAHAAGLRAAASVRVPVRRPAGPGHPHLGRVGHRARDGGPTGIRRRHGDRLLGRPAPYRRRRRPRPAPRWWPVPASASTRWPASTAVPAGLSGGRQVGDAFFGIGTQLEAVPLRLTTTVSEPSWWWRVLHG